MTRREEIEQQASLTVFPWDDAREQSKFEDGFIEGAKWADKTMIDKACEWITNNWREYVYQDGDGIVHFGHWENDFRKAMEE